MSIPRKQLQRSENSTDVLTLIPETEIIDWIDHLPFGGERWDTAIASVVRIHDAAKAKDTELLRKLSSNGKGGRLPKRLATLAVASLEQDDVWSATNGPNLALRRFFQFSHQYSFGWRVWMEENRRRTTEPSQSAPTTEGSDTEETPLEEIVETLNRLGDSAGPRTQIFALCGYRELITPELATAMLNLANDSLGLSLKPGTERDQKGGEHHAE
jgi:hypothetical protein